MIDLIYCAAGNLRFMQIAVDAGWLPGGRLPGTMYHAPYFADQDYKNPNRARYVAEIAKHKPSVATVIDWQTGVDRAEVMGWAEDIAPYVETVIVIPKIKGTVDLVPCAVGGKPVRLGYSVPTSYGGTPLAYQEFGRRPVHLLGGNPFKQVRLSHLLNVVSADTNYHQLMATSRTQFFSLDIHQTAKNKHWPTLGDVGLLQHKSSLFEWKAPTNAPYLAFGLSCHNIMTMWKQAQNVVALAM